MTYILYRQKKKEKKKTKVYSRAACRHKIIYIHNSIIKILLINVTIKSLELNFNKKWKILKLIILAVNTDVRQTVTQILCPLIRRIEQFFFFSLTQN